LVARRNTDANVAFGWFKSPKAVTTVERESLTELEEKSTKKLAELKAYLKAYLEKRVGSQEEEIKTLRSFLEIVDNLLAERSYRRVQVPSAILDTPNRVPRESSSQSITTMAGVHLADVFVEGHDLRIVPSPSIRFDVNAPPLRTFLLGKVLDPMKARDAEAVRKQELGPDREAVRKQELGPDRILSYVIDQDGSLLKQLKIVNFGDERRLNEIRNGVRWTLRKIYEKTLGT